MAHSWVNRWQVRYEGCAAEIERLSQTLRDFRSEIQSQYVGHEKMRQQMGEQIGSEVDGVKSKLMKVAPAPSPPPAGMGGAALCSRGPHSVCVGTEVCVLIGCLASCCVVWQAIKGVEDRSSAELEASLKATFDKEAVRFQVSSNTPGRQHIRRRGL